MSEFSTHLRTQLAKITHNSLDDDDGNDEYTQSQKAQGMVESVFELRKNAKSIHIHEDPSHRLHYGATVWKCCRFLCEYFDGQPIGFFKDKQVVELGAGTGLAGLALASLGAQVALTDTSMALSLLRHNLALNGGIITGSAKVMELEWYDAPKLITTEFSPPVDFVVASDVIYNNTSHAVLAAVISLLCDSRTIVYIAYEERGVKGFQENFFSVMKNKGFSVAQEFCKEDDESDLLHICILIKAT